MTQDLKTQLLNLGLKESLTKPDLWYIQRGDSTIYFDMRGAVPKVYSFQGDLKTTPRASELTQALQSLIKQWEMPHKKRVAENNRKALKEWVALWRAFYRLPKAEQGKRLREGRERHTHYISQSKGADRI